MLLSECHFVAPFLPRLLISLTTEISRADDYGGTVANRKARPLAGLSLNVPLRRDPVLGRDAVCGTGCSPLKQPQAPAELFNRFACLHCSRRGAHMRPQMATSETRQYRGYKIVPMRQWASWCAEAFPTRADLPFLTQFPLRTLAPSKEADVAEVKQSIDHILASLDRRH
jgi:hypothetical protein